MAELDSSVFKEIVDSIGLHSIFNTMGISFRDKGDRLEFSSPFRDDKHPSMSCYKNRNWCVDFAGEFKGSIFKLFREVTGKSLFSYYDVSSTFLLNKTFESFLQEEKKRDSFENIRKVKVEITTGFLESINKYPVAQEYCDRRGITKEIIDHFDIQVAMDTRINHTSYRNRICIPIYHEDRLISIEGRDFTGNSERKVMYPKLGSVSTIFNYRNLDPSKPLAVVEGLMDLVKVWTYITKNVTTPFGVWLTDLQEELFQKFPKLILFPDPDKGGESLISNFESFYQEEFEVAWNTNGHDPGDSSVEELIETYDNRVSATEYFLNKNDFFEPEIKVLASDWESLL